MREAVTVDQESGAAVMALLRSALDTERATTAGRHRRVEISLADLHKLTALLRPIFGTAAHVLVNQTAAEASDRDTLVDRLATDLTDPAIHDAFRVAARVALTLR